MPRRTVPLVPGSFYHIFNRGNNREPIFFEPKNYIFFLERIKQYISADLEIIAYCLMPNHYHLLGRARSDNLSHAMQMFSISYSKAINKSYQRVGSLFQGSFQAKVINRDVYLLHLTKYIHLNPVMAGLVSKPSEWEYSSYRDYIGVRHGTLPNPRIILSDFLSADGYRYYVEEIEPTLGEFRELLFDFEQDRLRLPKS